MAISDYTLSKLRAAQLARGLAAETEQARAQRQAEQNRANLSYLNALLQTGAQIPGMIGQLGAAQGAAGIQEATAGLSAGELESLIPSEVPVSPEAPVSPAGMSATSALMGTAPAQPAPAEAAAIPTDQMQFEDIKKAGIAGYDMSKIGELPAEEPIEPAAPAEATYNRDAMIEKALKKAASAAERAPQQQTDVQRIFSAEKGPTVSASELEGAFATPPATTAEPISPKPVEKGPAIETITVPGLNIQVPRPSAQQVPAEPAREVLPSASEAAPIKKELEEISKDPFDVAQEQFIKKLNSYKPPKYKVDASTAAENVVEDTWKNKQPNAILNLLSFGQYNNNLENAKRLAKKLVKGEIETARKQDATADRKQFIETAKLEAQQLVIMQKEQNARRKEEIKVKVKALNPEKAVGQLQNYQEVDRAIGMLEDTTRGMIRDGVPFPGGAKYNKILSDLKAFIAAPEESKAVSLNASLGAMGLGTGAGGSLSKGQKTYNSDALTGAIEQIQASDMDDASKEFLTQQMLLAQTIGKAREGGRMTDADLKFYLNNLFVTNANKPSTLLKSFNRMKQINANSQNDWLGIYSSLYPDMQLPFSALSGTGLTQEELDAADAIGFYGISPQTAAAMERARQTGSLAGVAAEGSAAVRGMLRNVPVEVPKGAQPPPPKKNKPGAKAPKNW